jgi:hypothetical protein
MRFQPPHRESTPLPIPATIVLEIVVRDVDMSCSFSSTLQGALSSARGPHRNSDSGSINVAVGDLTSVTLGLERLCAALNWKFAARDGQIAH